jgi:hypothetical protein
MLSPELITGSGMGIEAQKLTVAYGKAMQLAFAHLDAGGWRRRLRTLDPELVGKTVCPPLPMRWLALRCASEGCSGEPSRSSSQEDEPWQIIGKHSSESMWPS